MNKFILFHSYVITRVILFLLLKRNHPWNLGEAIDFNCWCNGATQLCYDYSKLIAASFMTSLFILIVVSFDLGRTPIYWILYPIFIIYIGIISFWPRNIKNIT